MNDAIAGFSLLQLSAGGFIPRLADEEVLKYHLTAEDVYKATEYIRDIINFIKKPKVVRPKIEFIRL